MITIAAAAAVFLSACSQAVNSRRPAFVATVAGIQGEIGEPFGLAVSDGKIFVSDGEHGKIWQVTGGKAEQFAAGLDTPSGIAFDADGNLIVADAGSNTIASVNAAGEVMTIAGTTGQRGFADGPAAEALFNGPIGVAIDADGTIFVADTYNDRIRKISDGVVTTVAGGTRGFADGPGTAAMLDTPTGVAVWHDKLLVADSGNDRIRVIEPDGRVWTLAGDGGEGGLKDGPLLSARFVLPTSVAIDAAGAIFVTDGNAVRMIGGNALLFVRTISHERRGLADGEAGRARFNRPSGLAIGDDGSLLVADSDNGLLRAFTPERAGHEITADEIAALSETPENFRNAQPPRWPYDPPDAVRDIAGTLGEIRGEIGGEHPARFHNGLDIAGAYGETARFIRDEKVLMPAAAENFGTLRELVRMPTLGYIHIRLGRGADNIPFGDDRFQFSLDGTGKLTDVRVPRGAEFKAGEPIGTLNAMNHVHLIAGRTGGEMNALDALILPGLTDSRPPVIEKLSFFDQNWSQIETTKPETRIKLTEKTRIVIRSYDQADGNAERRRLGLYRVGYQILSPSGDEVSPLEWTITFDRFPVSEAVPSVYAPGSRSGATGETIFNYIVTNRVGRGRYGEGFLDPALLAAGTYTLRIFAGDYHGNTSSRDATIEVTK